MADDDLRDLERRWQRSGDPVDAARLERARARVAREPALVIDLRVEFTVAPAGSPDLQALSAGWDRVVVDLSRCDYIASFMLAGLIALREDLQRRGGDVVLCTSDPRILHVLDMLGLRELLLPYPALDDALRERGWTAAETVVQVWRVFD